MLGLVRMLGQAWAALPDVRPTPVLLWIQPRLGPWPTEQAVGGSGGQARGNAAEAPQSLLGKGDARFTGARTTRPVFAETLPAGAIDRDLDIALSGYSVFEAQRRGVVDWHHPHIVS